MCACRFVKLCIMKRTFCEPGSASKPTDNFPSAFNKVSGFTKWLVDTLATAML